MRPKTHQKVPYKFFDIVQFSRSCALCLSVTACSVYHVSGILSSCFEKFFVRPWAARLALQYITTSAGVCQHLFSVFQAKNFSGSSVGGRARVPPFVYFQADITDRICVLRCQEAAFRFCSQIHIEISAKGTKLKILWSGP